MKLNDIFSKEEQQRMNDELQRCKNDKIEKFVKYANDVNERVTHASNMIEIINQDLRRIMIDQTTINQKRLTIEILDYICYLESKLDKGSGN
jgi:hypothetical protein